MEAKKYDAGKPRMELLPAAALMSVSDVLSYGSQKYDSWNWKQGEGLEWGRVLGAALRHTFKFIGGEDKDEESGLPHLAHAACCLLFVLEYYLTGYPRDDRFTSTVAGESQSSQKIERRGREI